MKPNNPEDKWWIDDFNRFYPDHSIALLENASTATEIMMAKQEKAKRDKTEYFIQTLLDEQAERQRESYQVHQIHGESGRTTDGRKLYWAKVTKNEDLTNNKQ